MTKNKKAIGKMLISIILTLLGIYLSLYILPDVFFPRVKLIRNMINYFLILIFFVIIQIGLIYAYYKLGKYATRGFKIVQNKLTNWSINIRNYIIIHS